MSNPKLLVISTEPSACEDVRRLLHSAGFEAIVVAVAPNDERHAGRWPTVEAIRRTYAAEVLGAVHGNKTLAADTLGVDRKTLHRLIRDPGEGDLH